MFAFRSRTSTSRFTSVLGAGAIALAAIAATGGLSASAVAQPVSAARASTAANGTSGSAFLLASQKALSGQRAVAATTAHRLGWKQEIAWRMMHRRFHWRSRYQFRYVNELWIRESSWNVHATNPYSGAYGIPQAVPGSKMASAGPDWRSSARTQIRWGLGYIKGRYGTPHRAWAHECAYGWY